MHVALEQHIGKSMASGREVRLPQYRIRVDGVTCGYIGFHEGAKICLTQRFGPIERKEIERQVGELIERNVASAQVAEVPPEMLNTNTEEVDVDDFDA